GRHQVALTAIVCAHRLYPSGRFICIRAAGVGLRTKPSLFSRCICSLNPFLNPLIFALSLAALNNLANLFSEAMFPNVIFHYLFADEFNLLAHSKVAVELQHLGGDMSPAAWTDHSSSLAVELRRLGTRLCFTNGFLLHYC